MSYLREEDLPAIWRVRAKEMRAGFPYAPAQDAARRLEEEADKLEKELEDRHNASSPSSRASVS